MAAKNSAISSGLESNVNPDQTEIRWNRVDRAFVRLKQLLEISHSATATINDDENEEEGVLSLATARASALPVVKVFAFGTHLLRLSNLLQPFACVAFGTIDIAVYVDIFWEAIAEADDAQIHVYYAKEGSHNVVFELDVGEFEFRVLYHQCNDLLRSYPHIISAPSSFLTAHMNGSLHVADLVETLKTDQRRVKDVNICIARKSFNLIRNWALTQGRMGLGEAAGSGLTPKDILNILFDHLSLLEDPNYTSCVALVDHFIDVVYVGYSEPMHATPPLNKGQAFQDQVAKISIRDAMTFPNYIQLSVVFTCSGMRGGEWISMIEQRLWSIPKSGHNGLNGERDFAIWPTRLQLASHSLHALDDATSLIPYEGFYVIGYNDGSSILDSLNKVVERAARDKATILDSCFLGMKTIPFRHFTTLFTICQQRWPRKALPNPLDKELKLKPFPIKQKTKKVHKDGKKASKSSTEEQENITTTHLRPASHVLTRLHHDPKLDIDQYVVGYEDRHTDRMQEKAAAAWQRDSTHEEFIPEHRIRYFRWVGVGEVKGEIVWDRKQRLDKIFRESGVCFVEG